MSSVTLGKLHQKVNQITLQQIQQKVKKIVLQDSADLIDEKEEELEKGVNPDGSKIGVYKSKKYRAYKLQKNPKAKGYVDLINTGSFKRKIYFQSIGNGKFSFSSLDDKTEWLIKKYGSKWKGLNEGTFNKKQKEYVNVLNKQLKTELSI